MKEKNDEITHLFRLHLDDMKIPVRDGFWEELEKDIPVAINHRRIIFSRYVAIASVLLILVGASTAFWFLSPDDEIAKAFTQTAFSGNVESPVKENMPESILPSVRTAYAAPSFFDPTPFHNSSHNILVKENRERDEDSITLTISMSFSINSSIENKRKINTYTKGIDEECITSSEPNLKRKSWGIKLFTFGHFKSENEQNIGMQMFTSKNNALNVNNAGGTGNISRSDFPSEEDFTNYQRIVTAVSPNKQNTCVKHKLPISIGLTVEKRLSSRFSLETGLVYTNLVSELQAGNNTDYYKQDQTLHYLGIPIKANVSFYEKRLVSLYTSVGGMIERCVSGAIKTSYYDHGENTYTSQNPLHVPSLQFSLSLSAGVQYKLTDRFSVYAEPKMTYYFADASPLATVRKDKPLNLNLLCGVRMIY
ncbi:hypothetical protein EZS27_000770 [termite gut metagenome]|uniref:Outer membrane protein beta-barrel domain-containing protein n=1 Tax=termite gut metagenome TaxID=433724 RepID=A0A5J4T2E9_9ZZZZ